MTRSYFFRISEQERFDKYRQLSALQAEEAKCVCVCVCVFVFAVNHMFPEKSPSRCHDTFLIIITP